MNGSGKKEGGRGRDVKGRESERVRERERERARERKSSDNFPFDCVWVFGEGGGRRM